MYLQNISDPTPMESFRRMIVAIYNTYKRPDNTEQWCTLNKTNLLYRNCRRTIHNNHKQ